MSSSGSQSLVVDATGRFSAPYPIHLAFYEESPSWFKSPYLAVADINGDVIFKVKGSSWSFRDRKVVYDASNTPVISLQRKMSSFHDRWRVFSGDSSDPEHLLFTVKRSSAFQMKTKLHVFMAGNTQEEVCDFMAKGSFGKKTCTVHKGGGDASTVVAQMSKKFEGANSSSTFRKRKGCFWMAVEANVDYCFITALVVVLRQLHQDKKDAKEQLIGAVVDGGVSVATA